MENELSKRILSSIALIPIALFFIIKGSFLFIFFISVCFCIVVYEWHMMRKKKSYYILGFLFLIFSFTTIYQLRFFYHINGDGYFWVLTITIICVATDIGGYTFGKLFKGPKLTKISPNKTYAGMFGGFLVAIIAYSIFVENLDGIKFSNFSKIKTFDIIYVIIVSFISQMGDLTISYFKRKSNIKNTGKIIPGHGGLLDRIDGMIFAFPFTYLLIKII